ncbi:NADH-quinone oxidoreductase subunit M [Buchnera aphidicola (Ceratovacuna keduensis)]|uniref:NADH-quinone oxidoreductase subunit M n=1 Tax=Buchnera aphidicola TaxID=9 RepID=UPI0031B8A94A
MLPFLVVIPLFGGIISWFSQKFSNKLPRFFAIVSIILMLLINILFFFNDIFQKLFFFNKNLFNNNFSIVCIRKLGINFSLYNDRFSLYMIFLTIFLGMVVLIFSYNENYKSPGKFYLNILFLISNIIGSFLSTNLFFFFLFIEIMIFPICFLNIFWGDNKIRKKNNINYIKNFFIHSQISSMIMLLSILLLVNYYHTINGVWTFEFNLLKTVFLNKDIIENFILYGFLLSFIIKMPVVPFHTWLPNTILYSPKGNSVDLIGFLSKVGVYGLLRFFIPISENIFHKIQIFMILLGIINVFYGTFMASIKNNLKHILSYINISHSGIILLSIFNLNSLSYEGLLLYIISSTISSSMLFILSNKIYSKLNTYNLKKMGGLWKVLNFIPGFFLFFSLSNFGLPGTGNFISEILIFIGFFLSYPKMSIFFTFSLIFFAFCSLKMFHRIFYGNLKNCLKNFDLNIFEILLILFFAFLLILIGLFPNFIFYKFNFLNIF